MLMIPGSGLVPRGWWRSHQVIYCLLYRGALQCTGDVYCHLSRLDDVIEAGVSWEPTLASLTTQGMDPSFIHLGSTLGTVMRKAEGWAEVKSNCYPYTGIVHLQAKGRHRWSVQRIAHHVPDSFCWEAKRRALAMGFALVVRLAARAPTTGLSQAFWMRMCILVGGSVEPELDSQGLSASSWWVHVVGENVGGNMARTMNCL